MGIIDTIRKDKITNKLFYEGNTIGIVAANHIKVNSELFQFKKWNYDFNVGLEELQSKDAERISALNLRFDRISELYSDNKELISNSDEYKALVRQIRNESVGRRWDYEKYMINNSDVELNNKVLGMKSYTEDTGFLNRGNTSFEPWTGEQLELISNGERPKVDLEQSLGTMRNTVEGSHGYGISDFNVGQIEAMYNPNNIDLQTPKHHFQIEHNGSFHNSSGGEINDIGQKSIRVRTYQREVFDDQNFEDIEFTLIVGVAAGSISSIIELRKMSKESLAWNRKKIYKTLQAFTKGLAIGALPIATVNLINNPIRNFVDMTVINNLISDGPIPIDGFLDNLADSTGDFLVITSAIAITKLTRNIIYRKHSNALEGTKSFIVELKRPVIEQTIFFAIDLILDNTTPIPDPTLSVLITSLRVSYSFAKLGLNIKHQGEIKNYRMDCLYEAAISTMVGL